MAPGQMIESYEDQHLALAPPDPIEAIQYRMEELGWTLLDLARCVGSLPAASRILHRRRKLTLPMIRKLHSEMGLSMTLLTQDYEIQKYESEAAGA